MTTGTVGTREQWLAAREDLLAREKEALGLYVSSHPLADVREQLARRGSLAAEVINQQQAAIRQPLHGWPAGPGMKRQIQRRDRELRAHDDQRPPASHPATVVCLRLLEVARRGGHFPRIVMDQK